MIICSNCFRDRVIIDLIKGLNQKGTCDICNKSDTYIYNTEIHVETDLIPRFEELISIYTPVPTTCKNKRMLEEAELLKNLLISTWNIFNDLPANKVQQIITSLCKEKYAENPELFVSPVAVHELYDEAYVAEYSLLKTDSWKDFVKTVKHENRFHTKSVNLSILKRMCTFIEKKYKAGDIFYRARIAPTSSGLGIGDMGAPPEHLATAGRANAKGIRCLYLANNLETPIHEVRAGAHDYVTVGKFTLKQDITVVDLKSINTISPFTEGLLPIEHAINKEHLNRINEEMGKALRRSDSDLDYIPTQYISDFIKSIDQDGIQKYAGLEYKSTLNSEGHNIAIFNPDLFDCISVETFNIKGLTYIKDCI